jgi:YhgE/Pip-like protein
LNDGYEKNENKVSEVKTNQEKPIMADPVVFNEEMVDPVKTYGTGFTPYFVPLSLWVGAMAMFLVASTMENKELKKRRLFSLLREVAARYLWLALVGVLQAVVLCTVLIKVLGLQVNHLGMFYLFTTVLALLSIAIFQFLTYLFGMAGDFVGVILLMLQLTSSGGSYPKETLPPFFIKIGPYLPMTYAVTAFRDIISGGQIDVSSILYLFVSSIILLILITSVFKWIFNVGLGMIKQNLGIAVTSTGDLISNHFNNLLSCLQIANLRLSNNFNPALGRRLGRLKEIGQGTHLRAHARHVKVQTKFYEKLNTWKHSRNRRN